MARPCLFSLLLWLPFSAQAAPDTYELLERSSPRPLRVHVLRVDLNDKKHPLAIAVGEDPDGEGTAETQLVPPLKLAEKGALVAAVNANAWRNLPAKPGQEASTSYLTGTPADAIGWVLHDGKRHSPVAGGCGVSGWTKKIAPKSVS